MTAAIVSMPSRVRRTVVIKQVDATRWSVEGYERQEGQWRFTWLLWPAGRADRAQQAAMVLGRHMGLPVSELPLGGRFRPIRVTGRGKA